MTTQNKTFPQQLDDLKSILKTQILGQILPTTSNKVVYVGAAAILNQGTIDDPILEITVIPKYLSRKGKWVWKPNLVIYSTSIGKYIVDVTPELKCEKIVLKNGDIIAHAFVSYFNTELESISDFEVVAAFDDAGLKLY